MASVNSFKCNQDLVQYLKNAGKITSDLVFNAMSKVDRKHFTMHPNKAYIDEPHIVAYQKTMSSAHMHAITMELVSAKLQNGGRILEIGSGTGYLTTCMAMAVGNEGKVIGMDCIPGFRDMAKDTVEKNYDTLTDSIEFVVGDGRHGYPAMAPYDIVIVGAAAVEIPQALIDQLAPGGRLIMPVGTDSQSQDLMQVDKATDGVITETKMMDVVYGFMTDVKEFEILWPDVKKNISSLNEGAKQLQEKLSSIQSKICDECQRRDDEIAKLSERIERIEKNSLERIGELDSKVEKLNSQRNSERDTEITEIRMRVDAIEGKLDTWGAKMKNVIDQRVAEFVSEDFEELCDPLENQIESLGKIAKAHQERETKFKNKTNAAIEMLQEKNKQFDDFVQRIANVRLEEKAKEFSEFQRKLETLDEKCKSMEISMKRSTEESATSDKWERRIVKLETRESKSEDVLHRLNILSNLVQEQRNLLLVHGQILKIQQEKLDKYEFERLQVKKRKEAESKLNELTSTIAKANEEIKVIKLNLVRDLDKPQPSKGDECNELSSQVGSFRKEMDLLKILMSYVEKERSYDNVMTITHESAQNILEEPYNRNTCQQEIYEG